MRVNLLRSGHLCVATLFSSKRTQQNLNFILFPLKEGRIILIRRRAFQPSYLLLIPTDLSFAFFHLVTFICCRFGVCIRIVILINIFLTFCLIVVKPLNLSLSLCAVSAILCFLLWGKCNLST